MTLKHALKPLLGIIMVACTAGVAAQPPSTPSRHQDLAAMTADVVRSAIVTIDGIRFEPAAATLQPGSERALADIVQMMRDHTDWRFEVQAHTDEAGEPRANIALSERRAQAIVEWLTGHGVASWRLFAKGFGDVTPPGAGGTDAGRGKNRRIDLKKLNEE